MVDYSGGTARPVSSDVRPTKMNDKLPCSKCGALILPATAARTGGLCMPCKQGNRENLERAKEYHKKQNEYDPFLDLWKSLVYRVYKTEAGFAGLTDPEKLYYVVSILDREVYNGGMHQYFSNAAGKYYSLVVDGLLELKAFACLKLLTEARELLFNQDDIPSDDMARNRAIRDFPDSGAETVPWCIRLCEIDKTYCTDPDGLNDRLASYAEHHGLVQPFYQIGRTSR